MVGNGREWPGMAGNGREWPGMAGNGREWSGMDKKKNQNSPVQSKSVSQYVSGGSIKSL